MMAYRSLSYCLLVVICSFFISQINGDNTTSSIQLVSSVISSNGIPTAGSNLTLKFKLFNNNPNITSIGNATVFGTANGLANNLPMAYYVNDISTASSTPLPPQSFTDGNFVEIFSPTFDLQFTATFAIGSNVRQGQLITFTITANYTNEGKA